MYFHTDLALALALVLVLVLAFMSVLALSLCLALVRFLGGSRRALEELWEASAVLEGLLEPLDGSRRFYNTPDTPTNIDLNHATCDVCEMGRKQHDVFMASHQQIIRCLDVLVRKITLQSGVESILSQHKETVLFSEATPWDRPQPPPQGRVLCHMKDRALHARRMIRESWGLVPQRKLAGLTKELIEARVVL
jgi:hypothetical protein